MNITWTCDTCKDPVEDHEGWITISYTKIHEYEEGKEAWEEAHPGQMHSLGMWLTYPEGPHWHVWHRKCDPNINSQDYTIDIERIRTQGELLSWTAHLLEKNWFPSTNWDDIIRRTLTQQELHV